MFLVKSQSGLGCFQVKVLFEGGVSLVLRGLVCLACPCLVCVLAGVLSEYVVVGQSRMMLGRTDTTGR